MWLIENWNEWTEFEISRMIDVKFTNEVMAMLLLIVSFFLCLLHETKSEHAKKEWDVL